MAVENLDNNTGQFNWLLWQLGIGSMACMFCVLFFGLKFKWFRAQLNFSESKSSKIAPVQGIGFKLKANPDDFQSYKVISEFAPVPFKPAKQNASLAATKITRSLSHSEEKISTNTFNTIENSLDRNVNKSKSMEQLSSKDLFTTPQNVPDVNKSETVPNVKKPENSEHLAQITNPVFETQNNSWRKAADEDENWGITAVNEKAKSRDLYEDEATDADDSYFAGGGMYSSQAANIFFGGGSAVEQQTSTRSNYLRRDSYTESIGSDTSA